MNLNELRIEMLRHGDTGKELSEALGISRQTLSRKFHSRKTDFTQKDMAIIQKRYGLSGERMTEIFFAENVS